MQPNHTLIPFIAFYSTVDKKVPPSSDGDIFVLDWHALSDCLSRTKINDLLRLSCNFSKQFCKQNHPEEMCAHDLWSLLYIGLCMSRHLEQPFASIFCDKISDLMAHMLEQYCASSHESRHTPKCFDDLIGSIEANISTLCQDITQALNENAGFKPKTHL